MMVWKHEIQMILPYSYLKFLVFLCQKIIHISNSLCLLVYGLRCIQQSSPCSCVGPWSCGCGAVRHMSQFVLYSFMAVLTLDSLLYRV